MILSKTQLKSSGQSWFSNKRYRVNSVVTYNNLTWQNTTGANSEPGVGFDWVATNLSNIGDLLTPADLTKETENTGATINLKYIGGHTTNVLSPNPVTLYNNIVNKVLNGNQTTLINAPSEPTVLSQVNIQLTGSTGGAVLNIGIFFYTITDINPQVFVTSQGSTILIDTGLTVSASVDSIILTGQFNGEISVQNSSGDLTQI